MPGLELEENEVEIQPEAEMGAFELELEDNEPDNGDMRPADGNSTATSSISQSGIVV